MTNKEKNKRKIEILNAIKTSLLNAIIKDVYDGGICYYLGLQLRSKEKRLFPTDNKGNFSIPYMRKILLINFPNSGKYSGFVWELTARGFAQRIKVIDNAIKKLSK